MDRTYTFSRYEITEGMLTYGGSFVQALAQCFRAADLENQQRLLDAFPEYFAQYDEMLKVKAARRPGAD